MLPAAHRRDFHSGKNQLKHFFRSEATTISINDTRRQPTEDADEAAEHDEIVAEGYSSPPRRVTLSSRMVDYVSRSPRLNHAWKLMPAACLIVAALCVMGNFVDAAFVIATLGVVSWFIEKRNRLRADDIESGERE
ncbi:MAG: hypothetical protein M3430_02510 [Acidobacteriota bacterium]|nr:hypothetical protein [Acidobacteriota bacterium]